MLLRLCCALDLPGGLVGTGYWAPPRDWLSPQARCAAWDSTCLPAFPLPSSLSLFSSLLPFLPSVSSPPSLASHLCVCVSLCLCSVCVVCGAMVHMWGSENWQESVLSFHSVRSEATQVALPAKPFYWPERICSRCWGQCCWPSTTFWDHR